jgi:HEAT repeat protein
VDFARRQEKAAANPEAAGNKAALIDVLAQFPDATAAEAIALQLRDPAQRGNAAQALLKLGPVASGSVLGYVDDPDADVRNEARALSDALRIAPERQLEQTLADVANPNKERSRTALQHLAQLRPDEAHRMAVSRALNAPLLDPDQGMRDDALAAVQVWATPENTATLLQLLERPLGGRPGDSARVMARVGRALIAIGPAAEEPVVALLRSPAGLVRREACQVLAEIGTGRSVQPLNDAGRAFLTLDTDYYNATQLAIAKIQARM